MADSPYIHDVVDQDFEAQVMRKSLEVPVLVDFWAEWCGPCKSLTPTLEKLVGEYKGRFHLAKVNVDIAQQVASIFRIQSIPTVLLFVGGQPVDGFMGAQPEKQIRELLDKHLPPAEDDPLERAQAAYADGDLRGAYEAYIDVVTDQPEHPEALLGLVRCAVGLGEPEAAQAWVEKIPEHLPERAQGERVLEFAKFADDAGDLAELTAKVEADRSDAAAWYSLGATHATRGDLEAACQAFLKVVANDRTYKDDAGRTALLSVFDLVGAEDPITQTYRRRLAALLF